MCENPDCEVCNEAREINKELAKKKRPSALETMRREMQKRQQAQNNCVNDHGIVIACYREKYNILTREIREIDEAIKTFIKIVGE